MSQENSFTVEVLKPHRVILFTFADFKRQTVDIWYQYVEERDGQFTQALKVIYDMRQSGLPTPYLTTLSTKAMRELQIPNGTRTAYLVSSQIQYTYYRFLAARMPKRAGLIQVFKTMEDALVWVIEAEAPTE